VGFFLQKAAATFFNPDAAQGFLATTTILSVLHLTAQETLAFQS
jgi:hypothetical protein